MLIRGRYRLIEYEDLSYFSWVCGKKGLCELLVGVLRMRV